MASAAPWAVKTKKCKIATPTPNTPKRQRAPLDNTDSRPRVCKQETLTQIQWVSSRPVSFDDDELEPLEVSLELRRSDGKRVPCLKKRDSTLTQMDFFNGKGSAFEIDEGDLKMLAVSRGKSDAVYQLDGIYESPRKRRPSTASGVEASSLYKRKAIYLTANEAQEYAPTTKRRKSKSKDDGTQDQGQIRRSSRHSRRVLSDPAENFAVFHEKLADSVVDSKPPRIEMKDHTGFDEDTESITTTYQDDSRPDLEIQESIDGVRKVGDILSASYAKRMPRTPQKQRDYIPSSQSPESLPPSTKRKPTASTNKQISIRKRSPLAELSANTPARRKGIKLEESYKNVPAITKAICTLKLPSSSLRSIKKRIEDSQADIWSVQATSSPDRGPSQRLSQIAVTKADTAVKEKIEIPLTNQFQSHAGPTSNPSQPANGETQESLMSLKTMFETARADAAEGTELESQHSSHESDVRARDSIEKPQQMQATPKEKTQYVVFLQSPSRGAAANNATVGTDDESDFGSPIANDTQFAADIRADISTSPLRMIEDHKPLNPKNTIRIPSSISSKVDEPRSPLLAPRLVDRVEYQNSTTIVPTKHASSSPLQAILPPTERPSATTSLPPPFQISTQELSSSQELPCMPPPSQRPIAPASLPHPSQMSTQEPSQLLPQLSSVPTRSPVRTDRITIKDSSSMHEHFSQIPEYDEDELQLQRDLDCSQHIDPNDNDDEDEDDLDPRSPRKTVHFVQSPQRPVPPRSPQDLPCSSYPSQQANFTQNGHVTAARIEDMRRRGLIPPGYNPPAYKVPSARELLPAWMFEDDDD